MKAKLAKLGVALVCAAGGVLSAGAADGMWTNQASGVWSDTSKWADGIVAGGGGTATFKAASGTHYVTNDLAAPVVLSGLSANPDAGNAATWNIAGGTNELVAPAVIRTAGGSLSLRTTTLSGDTDVMLTGSGRLFLGLDNLFTGRTIVSNGYVRAARDSGFGPAPETFRPDAIVLDWGGLQNDENNFVLTNHPNRGITVRERGGFIAAAYTGAGIVIESPITGPGLLGIGAENCWTTLNNPANDYSGGTVVGTNGPGAHADYSAKLALGQDEVLPHGGGKGGLLIAPHGSWHSHTEASRGSGQLDLNGRTETVNTLHAGPKAQILSSVAGQGRLIVGGLDGDNDYRGTLTGGATIEKQGAGALDLGGARLTDGTVDLRGGTARFGGPNFGRGATLLFNGGGAELTRPSGLHEFRGAGGSVVNLGAALTYAGWRLWPEKGSTTDASVFPENTQYVYRGRWRLAEAGVYSFAKGFDDGAYLAIDGVTVISNNVSSQRAVVNDVALGAGWHTVELRYTQGGGGVGPQFNFRNGILCDPENGGFTNAAELARARLFTDDGGPDLVADGYDNVLAGRLMLAQDATLTVPADAGRLVFAGIVTTNVFVDPEPVLTVDNGGAPLPFGSDGGTPAVLDAAVATSGGIALTNRVWLRRLPAAPYGVAAGADLVLDGPALLGDAALNLTGWSASIVRDDSVGGDGSVTANAGTTVRFDTMRYAGQALANDPATAAVYANDVTLNGGTARFTGEGTITYGGALTGAGGVVKDGNGSLLLPDNGSSLSGEIRIDAGRLLPENEAALGGADVRVNGGRLTNPAGADLTLAATRVIAQTGGFEVTGADETMTLNGPVEGAGNVSKWGDGTLVLGGTAGNTDLNLHVRGGTVELAKSGGAADYAVQNLIGVESNTQVRLTGSNGNQIGGGVALSGGTLDLNGISEGIAALTNTPAGGTVVNNGAQPATLTVGEGGASSAFTGLLTDGASALAVAKAGAGTLTLPVASVAYTGGTRVEAGALRITKPLPPTANLSYWLDATDAASLTLSNGFVAAWADASGNGVNFSQSTISNRPAYVANALNGLPAVQFGSGGRTRLVAGRSATARTVFIVSRMTTYVGLAGLWGQAGNDNGIRLHTATSYRHTGNEGNNADFSFNGQMYINGVAGFSFAGQPLHILSAVSAEDKVWTAAIGDYWFSSSYARYFAGYIGEILVYNTALGDEARRKVEAYLTAKWFGTAALTLEQAVTIEGGARLAVGGFNLELGALSGGGDLHAEANSVLALPGYAAFTGTVSGAGAVSLRAPDGADARFVPNGFETVVRNDGPHDAVLRVENTGTNTFSGAVQDGTGRLGITQSGTGVTYYSGTNSTYTGGTRIEAGTAVVADGCFAKYVRFAPILMRIGGQHYATNNYQLSEFRLLRGGAELSYPAGIRAYDTLGLTYSKEPPSEAIDGSTGTKFFASSGQPNKLVVELPHPVMFDAYRWYTANDAVGRDPIEWKVEVSLDGASWTVADYQDYGDDPSLITQTRFVPAGTWSVASGSEMNVFSDVSAMTVAAPGTLAVSDTGETVGPLSGDGAVILLDGATLGINAFADAAFAGGIGGTGTVVKTGAAAQSLSGALTFEGTLVVGAGTLDLTGAALTGVTGIVVKAGAELTGAAAADGNLTVTFEAGGRYSASLAVAGALTVAGPVTLALPEGAAYPYRGTLFTYASADQATRDALLNAVRPSPVPAGHAAIVRVTDGRAELVVAPVGTVLRLQ